MAGTDTNDTAGVPLQPEAGGSLHRVLELLVGAGLSNVQARRAATSLAARAFVLTDRGAVAPRLRVDLVLIDGDPLADLRATGASVASGAVASSAPRRPSLRGPGAYDARH